MSYFYRHFTERVSEHPERKTGFVPKLLSDQHDRDLRGSFGLRGNTASIYITSLINSHLHNELHYLEEGGDVSCDVCLVFTTWRHVGSDIMSDERRYGMEVDRGSAAVLDLPAVV